MIHVSEAFRAVMADRTDFREYAIISFADGKTLELDSSKFTLSKNRFISGASASSLPLGVAICKQIQLEIMNDDEWLKDYDFTNAEIELYAVFELSGDTTESVKFGTFTATEPETYGTTISVTAFDDMYRSDGLCVLSLGSNEVTAGEFLSAACDACGIELASTEFFNSDFPVQYYQTMNITYRSAIGYIAMIAGGNAYIDSNRKLRIRTYDLRPVSLYDLSGVDGGSYNPWTDFEAIDGGSYAWTDSDDIDAGWYNPWSTDSRSLVKLDKWSRLKIDTYPITITGLKIIFSKVYRNPDNSETDRDVYYLVGTDKYALEVENPLLNGSEKAWADKTAPIFIGASFIKFEGDHAANPISEFMDVVLIEDRKGNVYQSVLTDISFSFLGSTAYSNSAESTLRNGCKYLTEAEEKLSPVEEQIVEISQDLDAEKTVREQAIADLTNALADVNGMYYTYARQPDGSIITYAHDKKNLSESTNIIKINANAIGFSTDGGKTYPYGVTLDGTTITNILAATGISAEWIQSGTLEIADDNGNVLFAADADNKKVQISPYIFAQKDGLNIYKNGELAARITSEGLVTYNDGNPAAYLRNHGLSLLNSDGNVTMELISTGLRFFRDNTFIGAFSPAVTTSGGYGVLQISSSNGEFAGFAKYMKGTMTDPESDQTSLEVVLRTYTPGEKWSDRYTVDGTSSLPDGTTIPNITDHWYLKSSVPFYADRIYGTVHSSSDKRLKCGIKPTRIDAISTITKMRFKEFFWKSNGKFMPIGLIAQDVEDINPDLVCKPINDDDYYSLRTDSLICLTLKAIQEQESEIKELRQKIELMKAEIQNIKGENIDG